MDYPPSPNNIPEDWHENILNAKIPLLSIADTEAIDTSMAESYIHHSGLRPYLPPEQNNESHYCSVLYANEASASPVSQEAYVVLPRCRTYGCGYFEILDDTPIDTVVIDGFHRANEDNYSNDKSAWSIHTDDENYSVGEAFAPEQSGDFHYTYQDPWDLDDDAETAFLAPVLGDDPGTDTITLSEGPDGLSLSRVVSPGGVIGSSSSTVTTSSPGDVCSSSTVTASSPNSQPLSSSSSHEPYFTSLTLTTDPPGLIPEPIFMTASSKDKAYQHMLSKLITADLNGEEVLPWTTFAEVFFPSCFRRPCVNVLSALSELAKEQGLHMIECSQTLKQKFAQKFTVVNTETLLVPLKVLVEHMEPILTKTSRLHSTSLCGTPGSHPRCTKPKTASTNHRESRNTHSKRLRNHKNNEGDQTNGSDHQNDGSRSDIGVTGECCDVIPPPWTSEKQDSTYTWVSYRNRVFIGCFRDEGCMDGDQSADIFVPVWSVAQQFPDLSKHLVLHSESVAGIRSKWCTQSPVRLRRCSVTEARDMTRRLATADWSSGWRYLTSGSLMVCLVDLIPIHRRLHTLRTRSKPHTSTTTQNEATRELGRARDYSDITEESCVSSSDSDESVISESRRRQAIKPSMTRKMGKSSAKPTRVLRAKTSHSTSSACDSPHRVITSSSSSTCSSCPTFRITRYRAHKSKKKTSLKTRSLIRKRRGLQRKIPVSRDPQGREVEERVREETRSEETRHEETRSEETRSEEEETRSEETRKSKKKTSLKTRSLIRKRRGLQRKIPVSRDPRGREVVERKREETRSEETRNEETRCAETRSEETRSEETRNEETRSEETRSEETRSEETRSEETRIPRREETRREETRSEETRIPRSEETRSEETRSEETRSEETRSEETRSEETRIPRREETRSEETRSEETRIPRSEETRSEETRSEQTRSEKAGDETAGAERDDNIHVRKISETNARLPHNQRHERQLQTRDNDAQCGNEEARNIPPFTTDTSDRPRATGGRKPHTETPATDKMSPVGGRDNSGSDPTYILLKVNNMEALDKRVISIHFPGDKVKSARGNSYRNVSDEVTEADRQRALDMPPQKGPSGDGASVAQAEHTKMGRRTSNEYKKGRNLPTQCYMVEIDGDMYNNLRHSDGPPETDRLPVISIEISKAQQDVIALRKSNKISDRDRLETRNIAVSITRPSSADYVAESTTKKITETSSSDSSTRCRSPRRKPPGTVVDRDRLYSQSSACKAQPRESTIVREVATLTSPGDTTTNDEAIEVAELDKECIQITAAVAKQTAQGRTIIPVTTEDDNDCVVIGEKRLGNDWTIKQERTSSPSGRTAEPRSRVNAAQHPEILDRNTADELSLPPISTVCSELPARTTHCNSVSQNGGFLVHERLVIPYVVHQGQKYVLLRDVTSLFFVGCNKRCSLPRTTLHQNLRSLGAIMCSFELMVELDKLTHLGCGTKRVNTGDWLVSVDQFFKQLPALHRQLREMHSNSHNKLSQRCTFADSP